MPAPAKKISVPPTPEGRARKWLKARNQRLSAEKIEKTLSPLVLAWVDKFPEKCTDLGTSHLAVVEQVRDSVDIEAARAHFGRALDPFIKQITVRFVKPT